MSAVTIAEAWPKPGEPFGSYAEVAHVTEADAFRARKPFDVEIVPDRLVAKLRRR
jgi:hypothetical protein